MNELLQSIWIMAVLLMLCLASYVQFLSGTFTFDDTVAVVKNSIVNNVPSNFSALFRHDFWGEEIKSKLSHKSYRPFTTLMFHIERAYFGFEAKDMKAFNLAIHCANTILVWRLLSGFKFKRLSSLYISALGAALFAVHPIHTEAVCSVVGRADLMFCLFFILGLLLSERKAKTLSGSVSVAFVVIILTGVGMLFKESAVTIPIAFVLVSFVRTRRVSDNWKQQMKNLTCGRNCFLIIGNLMLVVCRLAVQDFDSPTFKRMDNPVAFNEDIITRLLSQQLVYAINIWILFCPQWLSFDWAFDCIQLIKTIGDLRLHGVFFFYTILAVVLLKLKHNVGILLSTILLIVPFMPASGIIKVGFVVAERILYVPSIGICLLVSHSFVHLQQMIKAKWFASSLKSLIFFIMISYIFRTRERAKDWLTEDKLFTSALKVCNGNAKIHYNIARLATVNNQQKRAFYHYHKAIELFPQYDSALMNLGNLYREKGDLNLAKFYIKASLDVSPNFSSAWMNLGIVEASLKHFSKAEQSYMTALRYRQNYAICHYNLGNLYLEQKRYTEAIQNWQIATTLSPRQPKAWINILTMLDNQGLHEDAIRLSNRALSYLPANTNILFIRANIFGKQKQYIEAEALYKFIIEKEPYNFLFRTNLGVLYHRWNKLKFAMEEYSAAIKLNYEQARTARSNLIKIQSSIH